MEHNYSTYDLELLATVQGVEKFWYYIKGQPFMLKSDHKPLIPSLL